MMIGRWILPNCYIPNSCDPNILTDRAIVHSSYSSLSIRLNEHHLLESPTGMLGDLMQKLFIMEQKRQKSTESS
jgi:hypothetical protein